MEPGIHYIQIVMLIDASTVFNFIPLDATSILRTRKTCAKLVIFSYMKTDPPTLITCKSPESHSGYS